MSCYIGSTFEGAPELDSKIIDTAAQVTSYVCPIVYGKISVYTHTVYFLYPKCPSCHKKICFMVIKYSGSIAVHLGKKADEQATHRWSLFVRGPNHEDLSCFVEKVAFTLHPSFPEPVRGTVFSICLFIDLWCCVFEPFLSCINRGVQSTIRSN
jgi:hypothetical protein